jgi:hypothetical protein
MKNLYEMMANAQFFLFVLGTLGIPFFKKMHEFLSKCNATVFSYVCVMLTYVVFYIFT